MRLIVVGAMLAVIGGSLVALAAQQRVRVDMLHFGRVICRERATRVESEGVLIVGCADGSSYRIMYKLPCTSDLACTLGIDCLEFMEPVP